LGCPERDLAHESGAGPYRRSAGGVTGPSGGATAPGESGGDGIGVDPVPP